MKWQFIRFYVGIVVVLAVAGAVFYLFVRSDYERSAADRLERYMTPWVAKVREALAAAPEDPALRARAIDELELAPKAPPPDEERPRGWHPPTRIVAEEELALPHPLRERVENGEVVAVRGEERSLVYASVPGGGVAVVELPARRPRGHDDDRGAGLFLLLAPPIGILFLIGVAIFLLIRPIERRIASLTDVTRRFGGGALNARAQVGRTGTVDELEESFNAMAARIERLVDGQRELLRAVSHDLRTPLARVFFALDDAQAAKDPAEKDRHIERIDRSLVELNDLVEELTTYLRLGDEGGEAPREWTDLAPVARYLSDLVQDLRKEVKLVVEECDGARVFANPRYFKRAAANLVTNAITHAKEQVFVSCREEQGAFSIMVDDDGEGIPADERERIFEPFFRREPSRNLDLKGSGLGLAIVARIMQWHGGSVTVSESPHGGARFSLTFPAPGAAAQQ